MLHSSIFKPLAMGDPARAESSMSEATHLKCPCQHCGSSIEFPAHGIGLAIDCPHCSGKTVLFLPPAVSPEIGTDVPDSDASSSEDMAGSRSEAAVQQAGRRGSKVWLGIVGSLLVAGVGAFIALHKRSPESESRAANDPAPPALPSGSPAPSSSPPPETNGAVSTKSTKSLDDLKVGPIKLEKAKGSSLVYAVGVMKNASDLQRFGVTIELELTDAGGKKVGTAKDYRNVLEPRQEWRFRALILASKAVSASVAQIREEE